MAFFSWILKNSPSKRTAKLQKFNLPMWQISSCTWSLVQIDNLSLNAVMFHSEMISLPLKIWNKFAPGRCKNHKKRPVFDIKWTKTEKSVLTLQQNFVVRTIFVLNESDNFFFHWTNKIETHLAPEKFLSWFETDNLLCNSSSEIVVRLGLSIRTGIRFWEELIAFKTSKIAGLFSDEACSETQIQDYFQWESQN